MTQNDYFNAYNELEIRAYMLADKAKKHGIPSLEGEIDREKIRQKNPFELGLQLLCWGKDSADISLVLDGFINIEKDPEQKILNRIAKEAILGIQAGLNPGLLVRQLNSHVPFGKENADYIYEYEMKKTGRSPEEIKKDEEELDEISKMLEENITSAKKAQAARKPGESDEVSQDEVDNWLKGKI